MGARSPRSLTFSRGRRGRAEMTSRHFQDGSMVTTRLTFSRGQQKWREKGKDPNVCLVHCLRVTPTPIPQGQFPAAFPSVRTHGVGSPTPRASRIRVGADRQQCGHLSLPGPCCGGHFRAVGIVLCLLWG